MTQKPIYAIIDTETTGGSHAYQRVTEVAIVLHDGEKVLDTYTTLVNPEMGIPWSITQLTGISDSMVRDAPKFYEVAKKIVEFTKDTIFVAHNVAFDYGVFQNEFKRLGFVYQRKRLCTVRLGRRIIPGYRSYSLGNITAALGIDLVGAHRALNDALATAKLFEILVAKDVNDEIGQMLNHGVVATRLPKTITMTLLNSVPEACGVYYFYNEYKEVIYVGKSTNIRKRVMEHFASKLAKTQRMKESIHDITWEVTGGELIALLHESEEIKTISPQYNRAQKPKTTTFDLFYYTDEKGYIRFETAKGATNITVLASYTVHDAAKAALRTMQRDYGLCPHLCTSAPNDRACFLHQIKECGGACIGKELPEDYNKKAERALRTLRNDRFSEDFFVIDEGREPSEIALVLIENGKYKGFGYVDKSATADEWRDAIQAKKHTYDAVLLIREAMRGGKVRKVKI
jgi:DNA polymerase III subunit epsilon